MVIRPENILPESCIRLGRDGRGRTRADPQWLKPGAAIPSG